MNNPTREQLYQELDFLREEVTSLQKKQVDTENQISVMKSTFDATVQIIRAQREAANDTIVQKELRIMQLMESEAGLRDIISQYDKLIKEMNEKNKDLSSKIDNLVSGVS